MVDETGHWQLARQVKKAGKPEVSCISEGRPADSNSASPGRVTGTQVVVAASQKIHREMKSLFEKYPAPFFADYDKLDR